MLLKPADDKSKRVALLEGLQRSQLIGRRSASGCAKSCCASRRAYRANAIRRPTSTAISRMGQTICGRRRFPAKWGATIEPHPVFDTVKGAAVGTNLPVRTAAAPAYLKRLPCGLSLPPTRRLLSALRTDSNRNLRKPQHTGIKTALSKPEKRGS